MTMCLGDNMFKEKCFEAEIEEIISYSEKEGYRENFKKEERAWDSVERRSRLGSAYKERDHLRDDY